MRNSYKIITMELGLFWELIWRLRMNFWELWEVQCEDIPATSSPFCKRNT